MEAHVQFDICFTSNVFLHLYKYLFKGVDQSKYVVANDEPLDQFCNYLQSQYLSLVEAVYQILSFEITQKWPAVASISMHLSRQQLGKMMGKDKSISMMSSLLIYLARPQDAQFANLKFVDFYQQFTVCPITQEST